MKRINKYDFNLKESNYNWKVIDLNTNSITRKNLENYTSVTGAVINNNVKDPKLIKPVILFSGRQSGSGI